MLFGFAQETLLPASLYNYVTTTKEPNPHLLFQTLATGGQYFSEFM